METVFSRPFFRLYTLLWQLAMPFLRRRERLKNGWEERQAAGVWCLPADIWMQAASGGEARLAVSLAEQLAQEHQQKNPDKSLNILITTWTEQGKKILLEAQEALKSDYPFLTIQPRLAPLDTPQIVQKALNCARPRLLVLIEAELWPALMAAAQEKSVPVWVVNGRMTKTSCEWYSLIRGSLNAVAPQHVFAMTSGDSARFSRIFPSASLDILPNIKFDRAAGNLPDAAEFQELFSLADKVILLASVRKEEENLVAPVVQRLLQKNPQSSVVIVPRHLHRVAEWAERMADLGLCPMLASSLLQERKGASAGAASVSSAASAPAEKSESSRKLGLRKLRRKLAELKQNGTDKTGWANVPPQAVAADFFAGNASTQKSMALDSPDFSSDSGAVKFLPGHAVVWDTFGDLPRLYACADAVFVGGSLARCGGQNFLEALSCGVVPFVGPYLDNFVWALGKDLPPSLEQAHLLTLCESPRALRTALLAAPKLDSETRAENRRRFLEWLRPRTGASKKLAQKIYASMKSR